MIQCLSCKDSSYIFTFGANTRWLHGAGAAKHALDFHGAELGRGPFVGTSYGVCTKGWDLTTLPLSVIVIYVQEFVIFAKQHPQMRFFVTEIGTGLAKVAHKDMAIMFNGVPNNCILSNRWKSLIENKI